MAGALLRRSSSETRGRLRRRFLHRLALLRRARSKSFNALPLDCAGASRFGPRPMGTLFLVRHGQASAFEDNYDRLSSLGERQARLLGELWARRGVKLDRVFTGPRVRQQRTAEIAIEAGGLPSPMVLPELDEMGVEPLFKEHMPHLF